MKRKLLITVTLVYILLLGHFLYANFIRTVGPSYTIKSTGYMRDLNGSCPAQDRAPGTPSGCMVSCPDITGPIVGPLVRGFPFVIQNDFNTCGTAQNIFYTADFKEARALDAVYVLLITSLYVTALYVLGFLAKPSRPKKKQR